MTRAELGVEYLKEAARLERYMRKCRKSRGQTIGSTGCTYSTKCIWNALLQGIV